MSKFKNGTVKISNDIFNLIAQQATKDVPGVVALTKARKEQMDGKILENDIYLTISNTNKLSFEIHVEINLDYNVKEVCQKIQESVREDVESMTGLQVETVDVSVEKLSR